MAIDPAVVYYLSREREMAESSVDMNFRNIFERNGKDSCINEIGKT